MRRVTPDPSYSGKSGSPDGALVWASASMERDEASGNDVLASNDPVGEGSWVVMYVILLDLVRASPANDVLTEIASVLEFSEFG